MLMLQNFSLVAPKPGICLSRYVELKSSNWNCFLIPALRRLPRDPAFTRPAPHRNLQIIRMVEGHQVEHYARLLIIKFSSLRILITSVVLGRRDADLGFLVDPLLQYLRSVTASPITTARCFSGENLKPRRRTGALQMARVRLMARRWSG
jgi:hypothetical protein